MRLDLLLEELDVLIRTTEDVVSLEAAILDLAVRGRLESQRADDEPASLLLHRMKAQKERIAQQGHIRATGSPPPIQDSEIPYSVPASWTWCRLPEVYHDWGQGKPTDTFTYVDVSSVDNTAGVITDDLAELEPEEAPSRARKRVRRGTVIYSTVRPYLLNVAIVDRKFDPAPIVSTAFEVMHPLEGLLPKYLYYYLRSPPFSQFVESQLVGMAYPAISKTRLTRGLFPLPPLPEQERIVARADELLAQTRALSSVLERAEAHHLPAAESAYQALVEALDPAAQREAWQRIDDHLEVLTNTPDTLDALRQTILGLAMRGRLVRQDPRDQSASRLVEHIRIRKDQLAESRRIREPKDLPRIDPDAVPYALPANWTWTRLGELSLDIHYGYTASADLSKERFRLLRITDIQDNRVDWNTVPGCEIDDETALRYLVHDGDILIARTGGTIGKSYLVREPGVDAVFASYLIRVIPSDSIDPRFLKLFLESPVYWAQLAMHSKGTGQPNVNATALHMLMVPLPALPEQERIVSEVRALLGLCDQLGDAVTAVERLREEMLNAVLNSHR